MKQWYQLLLEKGVTHSSEEPDSPPSLLPSKLESKHPDFDFSVSYHLSRTFGLSPEQKTFNFKMMQSLLPTRERLARIGKVNSSNCIHCEAIIDTTHHLLTCTMSHQVAQPLRRCLENYFPNITPEDITTLKIPTSESLDLPVSWLIATCVGYIWQERLLGKQAKLDLCRAELFSRMNLFKET